MRISISDPAATKSFSAIEDFPRDTLLKDREGDIFFVTTLYSGGIRGNACVYIPVTRSEPPYVLDLNDLLDCVLPATPCDRDVTLHADGED